MLLILFYWLYGNILAAVTAIICIALTTHAQKPKVAAQDKLIGDDEIQSDIENAAAMLDYLVSRGLSPELSGKIVKMLTDDSRRKRFTAQERKKLNLLMNRILQYSVKQSL